MSASAGADVLPGATLAGRYVIDSRLGEGGYGEVYLARQLPLGREVAIKVLQSSRLLSQDAYVRFMREANLAQRLEHPNTVRLYDVGTTPSGLPFIVYERLRGRTLAQHLESAGPMARADVELVTAQILKALMEAHALGIVHRDIKPANIFVTSHPGEPLFVRVLDFGIAKDASAAEGPVGLTVAGQTIGTVRYMAPEQLAGESVGPATDIYSVGLLLAEMVSGAPVFPDDVSMNSLVQRISPSAKAPMSRAVLASPFYPIIERATAHALELRYPSCAAMLADLQALGRTPSGNVSRAAYANTLHAATTGQLGALARSPAPSPSPSTLVVAPAAPKPRNSNLPFIAVAVAGVCFLVGAALLAITLRGRGPRAAPSTAPSGGQTAKSSTNLFVTDSTVESLRSRTLTPPDAADVERRLTAAGYTSGGLRRGSGGPEMGYQYVLAGKRDCRGVIQFIEYASPEQVTLVMRNVHEKFADQVWIAHGRLALASFCTCTPASLAQPCAIDLADVVTR